MAKSKRIGKTKAKIAYHELKWQNAYENGIVRAKLAKCKLKRQSPNYNSKIKAKIHLKKNYNGLI